MGKPLKAKCIRGREEVASEGREVQGGKGTADLGREGRRAC